MEPVLIHRHAAPVSSPRRERLADADVADAFLDESVGANAAEVLERATHAVTNLLGGDRGSCILLDVEPRIAVSSVGKKSRGETLELWKYPEIEAAMAARDVVTIEDVRFDGRLERVQAMLPPRLRAVAVVPLLSRDRCLGVLVAQSDHPWHVGEVQLATASLLGKLAARLIPSDPSVLHQQLFAADEHDTPPESAEQRTVLVVDDDDDAAALVGLALTREGYAVTRAGDGETGLRLAREAPPDLIVLDVNMPKLDGYGVAQRLCDDVLTRDTPVLFLSGSPDLVARVRDLRLERIDFLTKPFKRQELVTRVQRCLAQAAADRRVRIQANLDELTGCANLRLLRERLTTEQSRFQRHRTPVCVLTVDVDKLKRINDTYGHAAGSVALSSIGRVLRHVIRDTDLAARTGGDEFVVVLSHASRADGAHFAARLMEQVRALRCDDFGVSVSIGVAALEDDRTVPLDEVLAQSDRAAYRAKRAGGDRACEYDASLDTRLP